MYSHGLRVIMKGQPPQEWRAPGKKQIEKACANERQVVLALAGGEIIFFELDEAMQNIQASKHRPRGWFMCLTILSFRPCLVWYTYLSAQGFFGGSDGVSLASFAGLLCTIR